MISRWSKNQRLLFDSCRQKFAMRHTWQSTVIDNFRFDLLSNCMYSPERVETWVHWISPGRSKISRTQKSKSNSTLIYQNQLVKIHSSQTKFWLLFGQAISSNPRKATKSNKVRLCALKLWGKFLWLRLPTWKLFPGSSDTSCYVRYLLDSYSL